MDQDIAKLAAAIRDRHSSPKPGQDYIWTAPPAQKCIDCVLSLNRQYDSVVLPRVLEFAKAHPQVWSLADLRATIDKHSSPAEFLSSALRTNDAKRADTLSGVTSFLIKVQQGLPGENDDERLTHWAKAAAPEAYNRVGVKGFGIAGFQYMRMLFGAETTKPDVHIIRFVGDVVGRKVTDVEALNLLEKAAAQVGVGLRWLDVAIWESRARAHGADRP